MKKIILLVLVAAGLTNGFVAKGQTEYLVTVDPATGEFTKVNSIPGVMYIATYPNFTTIESTNNHFIFVGYPPSQNPAYLYSLDNSNADIISNPPFIDTIGYLLYGDSSQVLYGMEKQNNRYYLVSVNSMTDSYATINILNNEVFEIKEMAYNHNLNQLILYSIDTSNKYHFCIADGKTGDIISQILVTYNYRELHFDNTTNQLLGLDFIPATSSYQFGIINISTGQFSTIYNFPLDENILPFESTFDEKDQEYIVVTSDSINNWHLYFISVATGKVVYRYSVETPKGNADNVVQYRYDNTTNILYALHWEEITMPVTLLSFTATKQAAQNLLQWATTQEVNSSYFTVERSSDGINFISIGHVNAAGNSSVAKSYSLTDMKPANGTDYYRLKMVDKDGKFSYSQIRSINEGVGFEVSIYPNPVLNILNLNISSDKAMGVQVEIVDNGGMVVAEQEIDVAAGASTQSINTVFLSNGSYYLRLVGADGETELKFVKGR